MPHRSNLSLESPLLWRKRVPPAALAGLAQLLALLVCGFLLWLPLQWGMRLNLAQALILESLCAVAISYSLRLPGWWLAIQALFVPALYGMWLLALAPAWYLAGFVLLASVYWSTYATQVPLYLSRRRVWQRVLEQLPTQPGLRFADLGSGVGGLVHYLARRRRDSCFSGIEAAPLPYWIGKLRALRQSNALLQWGNFWRTDLGNYDVVFAYLSPVPMPALWEKIRREMRPGTLFISYRFAVPGVVPHAVIEMRDLGRTQLYLWRV